MTSEQKFPIGWFDLVTDLRLTLMREFPGLSVLEMNGDRGWLHVRCDDRDLTPARAHPSRPDDPGIRHPVAGDLNVLRLRTRPRPGRASRGYLCMRSGM